MPEGHTLHRLARDLTQRHAGGPVRASSPQGRFEQGAEQLDRRPLVRVEALGKHLLYAFDDLPLTLHVHLGLFGRFRSYRGEAPEPRGAVRLRMASGGVTTDLSGPTACELLDPLAVAALRERIGPDPLREDADGEEVVVRFARTRRPIGAVLLDQSVIAGIGNVYRAEMLYRARLDPRAPARDLRPETVRGLWEDARMLLEVGVRVNRIVTVEPEQAPGRRKKADRLWVYKRRVCRTCGADIASGELGARTLYWCPACQTERQ